MTTTICSDIEFNQDTLDLYWEFVAERQLAWHNKTRLRLPRPWTNNSIIQDYSFTNMYRLLDPGTQYLLSNVLTGETSVSTRLFNTILYRCVGRESTMKALGMLLLDYNVVDDIRHNINDVFRTIKARGEPPFSKAYTVPGYEWTGGVDKIDNFAIQAQRWAKDWDQIFPRLAAATSPQEFYDTLREMQGIGNFIASQVYVDCTYWVNSSRKSLLGWETSFYRDWMKAGPGALDGLWRLTGKTVSMAEIQANDLALLSALDLTQYNRLDCQDFKWATLSELYPHIAKSGRLQNRTITLSLQDLQNTCCEFSKYHKLVSREGSKSRRRYQPRVYEPSEWSSNEFVARLALNPRLRMNIRLSRPEENGSWYSIYMDKYDVTEWISRYSGYPVEHIVGNFPAIFVADLDSVKYPPESGNSSPSTELTYHFLCGLQADIPVEIAAE